MRTKGFTLIELLVVIGIIAVLAVVVVLVLNPTQLFAQARDAQRLSDMATLQRAINYVLSTTSSATPLTAMTRTEGGAVGTARTCGFTAGCPTTDGTPVYSTGNVTTGWVGINFSLATGGSPLATLPKDPTSDATYHYAYKSNGTAYEVNGKLESTKYTVTTPVMTNDGGDSNSWYELGTSLAL
jgi:prepilin-type N-terminal cleavage/methylation domain-containing protein